MGKIIKDKSFWSILIISLLSMIFLIIGVVFLTEKNTKEFYSSGYIINSNTSKSVKYYFDDNTQYKINVFDEYVFNDNKDNKVKTSKDNFIHYLDNSLSFMKNGVILDLDNFDDKIVPYYNISDKSLIKFNNGGYYIETPQKTLVFGNFLGRINDNKYIVVGNDVRIKLSGNSEEVKGNFFEILFIDEGIVKIENQEGSYQSVTDGSIIYIGKDIKINLGSKEISYGDKTKISLSEMTIDGNENIDIKPKDDGIINKDDNNKPGHGGNDIEDNNGNGQETENNSGNGSNNNGTGTGEDGTEGEGDKTVLKKETSVNLVEASSDVNTIKTKFQVIDTVDALKGNLVLTLVDVESGKTVYKKILANTPDEQFVVISSLLSDRNYLMTVNLENNDKVIQYFQKSFRTNSLDLKLKRELVTENSLTYSLDFGLDSEAVSADVTLYDSKNKKINTFNIKKDSNEKIIFEGLEKNSLYRAVVSNVVVKNIQYDSLYTAETSDYTLKIKPTLGDVNVSTNNETKNFTLKVNDVEDEDKAIVKYTYEIFKSDDLTKETMNSAVPVYSFSRNKLDDEILKLDADKNLVGNTDYKFKVKALYFDNYRYNEIETIYSESFNIVGKPSIKFEKDIIDFNRISGKVVINDIDCTIPFDGRECNNHINNFTIRYYGGKAIEKKEISNIVVDPVNLTLGFDLKGLSENTLYSFEVFGDIDLKNGEGIQKNQYLGGFNVNTESISEFKIEYWKKSDFSYDNPISVISKLINLKNDDKAINNIHYVTFNLYKGNVKNTSIKEPIASYEVLGNNIKELLYNKDYNILSSLFKFVNLETNEKNNITNLDILREVSGGKLDRYYTIEITDCFDEEKVNEFSILNNKYVYEIPSILLLEEEVLPPEVVVDEITNIQLKDNKELIDKYNINYNPKLDEDIIRGYKVTAVFEKNKIEKYFVGSNPITKINFYVYDKYKKVIDTKIIDFVKDDIYSAYFFLENGTTYGVEDEKLARGNEYTFSYNLSINDDNNEETPEIVFPSKLVESEKLVALKQLPKFKYFISNSNDNSVIYKYFIDDYDNALVPEEDGKFYLNYNVGEIVNKSEISLDNSKDTFLIDGLKKDDKYSINYNYALDKGKKSLSMTLGNFYFEGYHKINNNDLTFDLNYGNFDNTLKIIINDNEMLDRVSFYLLTIKDNKDKYDKVITSLNTCPIDEETSNKCIIIDYSEISKFKGKNLEVNLTGFYDTGFGGYDSKPILADYFNKLGLLNNKSNKKVGYIFQTINNSGKGGYIDIFNLVNGSELKNTPYGLFGFELIPGKSFNHLWKLNVSNLIDKKNNSFLAVDKLNKEFKLFITSGSTGLSEYNKLAINPKVLDKTDFYSSDNKFKFTRIIPKVTTETLNRYINGVDIKINLSIDKERLETDFVKTNGKYNFYVDIFDEEDNLVKTVITDYEHLDKIVMLGLKPDTRYEYKIAADMNTNGNKVRTYLFDNSKNGYIEYKDVFSTLNNKEIFNRIEYDYESYMTDIKYDNRKLIFDSYFINNKNFDLNYKLIDPNGNVIFDKNISNKEFKDGNYINFIYEIKDDNFIYGSDYYNIVVTAVTNKTDNYELYNDKLIFLEAVGKKFHNLNKPDYTLYQNAYVTENKGTFDYKLNFKLNIKDSDKVIKDGKYFIELRDANHVNACPGNEDACRFDIDLLKNSCKSRAKSSHKCKIDFNNNSGSQIQIDFMSLTPNTNYTFYSKIDTYMNNFDAEGNVNKTIEIIKNQYTKGKLDFSLGAVTPSAVSKNKLVITFVGAANLTDTLVGIDYDINVQGKGKIASGSMGITNSGETGERIKFGIDSDKYPTITIPIDNGKEMGLNNYIIMSYYYYNKEGKLDILNINGETSFQYTVNMGK